MLSFGEAQKIIRSLAHSFGTEKLLLEDAVGRVLAEDVYADRNYPPFNRAAMDGYAIRLDDFLQGQQSYKVVDTIFAGMQTDKVLSSGACYKIMTGAAVPNDADAIIRREDAVEKEGVVHFSISELRPFQNIARKGEDCKKGALVLPQNTRCTASVMGVLASLGKTEVLVQQLPSVAVVTTGNEVVSVGEAVREVQIRNSNQVVIKTLLKQWDIEPSYIEHVEDDPKRLLGVLDKALDNDITILSGGVSAGDADYVPQVLEQLGVQKLFHKVAIRPGKPFWCGQKDNKLVFALPGNPLSTLVTFNLFVKDYINHCLGISAKLWRLPILMERKQKVKLDEFFLVKIEGKPSGLVPVAVNGSGDIRLGFEAEAIALHPSSVEVLKENDIVLAYSF